MYIFFVGHAAIWLYGSVTDTANSKSFDGSRKWTSEFAAHSLDVQ